MRSTGSIITRVYERKYSYVMVFLLVLLVSALLVQETKKAFTAEPIPQFLFDTNQQGEENREIPIRIEIAGAGIEANIANPNATDVETLDKALLNGAVRYPGSAFLGEEGNVLIFGHSSYLPIVHNQAYKAFNEIQNLKEGEEIRVYTEDNVYIYVVEEVREESADTGVIDLQVSGRILTLATCDTFGKKSDRFVVTAVLKNVQGI